MKKCRGVIEKGDGIEKNSSLKDDLKYITDKMLSKSYKNGFENIRDKIKKPEIYENIKSRKINVKMESDEILKRLSELEDFLEQPLCRETFCMKSIIYNYINRFWNCKVDAYICPLCAYMYALVPLGFRLVGNKFVFQNIDYNLNELINSNEMGTVVLEENAKHSEEKYATWVARTLNTLFELRIRELNNIPVILRGTNEKDRYTFNILHKDILNIIKR